VAISIYPRSKAFIQHQKRYYAKVFEGTGVELRFFDSKTHALAARVPVDAEQSEANTCAGGATSKLATKRGHSFFAAVHHHQQLRLHLAHRAYPVRFAR
jgi:hypothetical protein